MKRTRWRRRCMIAGASLVLTGIVGLVACDRWVAWSTASRIYSTVADIPARDVALVLGTRPIMPDGRGNLFFTLRMDSAAALWKAGKAKHLLVSGDNGRQEYDETTAMRDALMSRGVPTEAITPDYAGFRTLDSVVRARGVFGQSQITIVSQSFHDQRALFIADRSGIDAIGFAAPGVGSAEGFVVRMREVLARAKAVADMCVMGTGPRFPGPPEPITQADIDRGSHGS